MAEPVTAHHLGYLIGRWGPPVALGCAGALVLAAVLAYLLEHR